ncbi:MAG: ArnT family glycosyltransferase [Thermomicrobiales bacterium]
MSESSVSAHIVTPSRAIRRVRPFRVGEGALVAVLVFAATAIRLPDLLRYPHFTDETVEVGWALQIWQGAHFPLTASDAYYGPLHAYLVAGCLWLFGPSLILPRVIVLVIGVLTVVVTYWLGRELGGQSVGLVAGALLATAPQHIIVNSHVAWQNATTPFYAALCCWALVRGLHTRRGGYLLASGGLFGLTLQTHPGTIVLLPALLATFATALGARRSWALLRRPWPYFAVLAALITYSPVLIYNARTHLSGIVRIQTHRSYAYETHPSWGRYWHNLANLLFELMRMIANPTRIPAHRWQYFTDPHLMIVAALCLAGLVLLAHKREPLPLFALLSVALIMPRFNHAYGVEGDRFMLTGRYVAFLLPLLAVAIAVAAVTLGMLFRDRFARHGREITHAAGRVIPVVSLAILVFYPLVPLTHYYQQEARRDPDNGSLLATVRFVSATRGNHTPVLIDKNLDRIDLHDGAAVAEILDSLLTLDRVTHHIVEVHQVLGEMTRNLDPHDTQALPLVIMTRHQYYRMRKQVPLTRISPRYMLRELYPGLASYYAVYRVAPSGRRFG